MSGDSVFVDDHSTNILAVQHVLVTLVDFVQAVPTSHQLIQLEVTGTVEIE